VEERTTIYTAITGKDKERSDIKVFREYSKFVLPVMNAKIYKILPWLFLNCDISIWVDGNIFPLVEKERLVKEFLKDADMAIFKHPDRDCIYDEAPACKGLYPNNDYHKRIDEQIAYYQAKGIEGKGMAECNFIIRRHNKKVKDFCNDWWSHICRFSERDQLSYPVVDKDLKINYIKGNIRNHPYFKYIPH